MKGRSLTKLAYNKYTEGLTVKELMSYIPRKHRPHIMDFYKDSEDGTYWLSLRCDGKYCFEDYVAEYTIHEDTITEVLQVFRGHIKKKTETE